MFVVKIWKYEIDQNVVNRLEVYNHPVSKYLMSLLCIEIEYLQSYEHVNTKNFSQARM